jgi:DNA-binding IscR family transcriptional regulator
MNGAESTSSILNGSTGHPENPEASNTILSNIWAQVQEAEQSVLRVISLQSLVEQHQKLESQRSVMYHI